jgi:hypothetical protein
LQNGTHRGKGGATDQSIHGRMGLGTACKGGECFDRELWRKKIMSLGSGKLYIHRKIPIYIYIYIKGLLFLKKGTNHY